MPVHSVSVLTINTGSSSLKAALYRVDGPKYELRRRILAERIGLPGATALRVLDGDGGTVSAVEAKMPDHGAALAAGAAILPFVLLMFLLSRWSGGLLARYGARRPLIIGPIIAGAGFALLAVPGVNSNYWTTFFPAVVVLGLGMATSVAPLTTTVMSAVDAAHTSLASGINNAVSRTAGVLALAILTVVAVAVFSRSLDGRLGGLGLSAQVQQAVAGQGPKLAAAEIPAGVDSATSSQLGLAIAGSFVTSFRVMMLIGAGLAFGASACAFITIKDATQAESNPKGSLNG